MGRAALSARPIEQPKRCFMGRAVLSARPIEKPKRFSRIGFFFEP